MIAGAFLFFAILAFTVTRCNCGYGIPTRFVIFRFTCSIRVTATCLSPCRNRPLGRVRAVLIEMLTNDNKKNNEKENDDIKDGDIEDDNREDDNTEDD